ncbi:GNAT family N-acetyltransferase [Caproiciproducens faecalis]|uniref:GNAT family N-acetyltransferase n=1 Tax=Caproiciproducens faecalis TaxID=2820301 RepID=A0ABS7DMM1_9FIRM|nr:GNAT family N-acetyltransferase [Caproiciproducens faecalis]MBW7572354.1 GNAT family N-acetyltransferase [Caproiciproducens faecalis]
MGNLQIIPFEERENWDAVVRSFARFDVYYLSGYVSAFRFAKDGAPFLLYYRGEGMRLCYVVQQRDIAESPAYSGILERGRCFDWSTPYGYGGPLTEGFSERGIGDFFALLSDYCRSNRIVSQFIRFHPLLENYRVFEGKCELYNIRHTVYMNTKDKAVIDANLESRCRGAIHKAMKNHVQIENSRSEEAQKTFIRMYYETMQRRSAADYYYFSEEFFDDFFAKLADCYRIFYAVLNEEIICSAIIMYCNGSMHYHLSAARKEYFALSPNSLLLYTAACWGAENGCSKFHLGGGVGAQDSLFLFKRSFHKKGLADFYIGRNIFCEEVYRELLKLRAASDPGFCPDNDRLIQYRA